MLTIQQINDEAQRLRSLLHDKPVEWFDFSIDHDGGSCHVRIDDRYRWIGMERGQETAHDATDDPDELLYWIVGSNASGTAQAWELRNRHPSDDSRRGRFTKELELLARVNPLWVERRRAEHAAILARHPFNDEWT